MVQLSPRSAVEESTYEQNRKQPMWHILVPNVPCMLSPIKNTFGTASAKSRHMIEGNVIWRLSREQQEKGCSTKEGNPGARGGSCPGVGMVSSQAGVSNTITTEGKCSGSSDLPVVQVPGEGTKDPVGATKTLLLSELLQKTVEKF